MEKTNMVIKYLAALKYMNCKEHSTHRNFAQVAEISPNALTTFPGFFSLYLNTWQPHCFNVYKYVLSLTTPQSEWKNV